jgi:hypothetical protein
MSFKIIKVKPESLRLSKSGEAYHIINVETKNSYWVPKSIVKVYGSGEVKNVLIPRWFLTKQGKE